MVDRNRIVYHRGGLVFALREGEVAHIDDVPNGARCGCVCEECRGALVARNQGEIRASHFAHAAGQACDNTGDAGLARSTASILAETHQLLVPDAPKKLSREESPRLVRVETAAAVIEPGKAPEVRVTASGRPLRLFVRPNLHTSANITTDIASAGISAMQLGIVPDHAGIITAGTLMDALTSPVFPRWWLFNARAPLVDVRQQASTPGRRSACDQPPAVFTPRRLWSVEESRPQPRQVSRDPGPRFCWRCEQISSFQLRGDTLHCTACNTQYLGTT